MSSKHWKGDWLFRRERLELVDEQLRVSRPDIIVFQELLTRRGSPSESDINILDHGALEGYEWDAENVAAYKDTQEVEYQATAVGLPVKLSSDDHALKKSLPIGYDGFMSHSILELDDKAILLVNLSMPTSLQRVDHWYGIVGDQIDKLLESSGICKQRLIVSGYIPGGLVWQGFVDFVNRFGLKDTAAGFCEANVDCLTTNTQNDLFMVTAQGQSPSHSERIMVNKNAIVSFSTLVMNKTKDKSVYGQSYGLQRQWASRTFGWLADVRLQGCPTPSIH